MTEETQGKWAVVELMGHVKKAGKIREVEEYGAVTLRIDVPECDGIPAHTQDFNWKNAGYSITYTTEDVVMRYLQTYASSPVILYDRPQSMLPGYNDDDVQDIGGSNDDNDSWEVPF